MARPKTKNELIEAAEASFTKMWQLIDSITEQQQERDFNFGSQIGKETHWLRDENLKDVLIHLYEWHQLLLKWLDANQEGNAQPFLPQPYNWRTYPKLNVEFKEAHQATKLAAAKNLLKQSHLQVMSALEQFSDIELFEKQHFTWTGASNLGSYFISATSSHYQWAIKKIKLHQKTLDN
ncbi:MULTISPECIES: ClbS/DfsB family four-helix bundle protein [unclassified Enterococcus]|uniref:ClbS/DfsB family four-helix bundle protein n=1 Tax=unclassified Enterococcus TaxID=2608891 RepID=UPI0015545472|nr:MULTISPECIES: ClbS/DfsB family four-helix bundle protein [unclassified Enterococcus]MBS7578166.1 ClbS/DfsB family four-helix bundle protein [Enterococcus sp. MMGLQ5-2]MBS7584018.1 ClbS/DfsB family four-helix bundle protein [Enterococcus sp. MMGLQ5-1]NPD11879.1 ClbS/DfsB family four-helix bundle protein [Enterococcus sp. MMGLQ5-1]NPD37997.1 ClbS/DfsB family four-helix bundle protein [Enterococcus sp. MMGLQ5-2]